MIHLALRTEFSFKSCYGFLDKVTDYAESGSAIGIADFNSTFGHIKHHKNCREKGIKPILGVRLMVCNEFIEKKKTWGPIYIFIARNSLGLSELYALVTRAYEQFYYHPRICQADLSKVSSNIIVIANTFNTTNRIDFIGIDQTTPKVIANWEGITKVAICLNWYPDVEDKSVYELFVGDKLIESQTYPQFIMSERQWARLCPSQNVAAPFNTQFVANQCEDYELPKASLIKYSGQATLFDLCLKRANQLGINLVDTEYGERLKREFHIIESKGFGDYFLVVAQMVQLAKSKMLVGPSRGSSAGSLVCYLTGITEVDPLKFDLLFERFVDLNRTDLPDIDVDFPDTKRKSVIKTLTKLYGEDHVAHISTVSTRKPRSAIADFAFGLGIPPYETEELKDAVLTGFAGDTRSNRRIEDTFETTLVGREFIKKFPEMQVVIRIEGHSSHAGVHAAGVIVCNEPLTTFGTINARMGALQMDFHDAEDVGLLKVDCLGLKTLSILEEVATQIGMPFKQFYNLPLDDKPTLDIFNAMRLSGIFQFQGPALQFITRKMGVRSFHDICAITALGRPGPMKSGGTNLFIDRATGKQPVEYLSNLPCIKQITESTLGVIVYQEQLMQIAREYAGMSWEHVSELRRAISKSKGEEFLEPYKEKFVSGAIINGPDLNEAEHVWENIVTFGAYGFNKSHAYGYGLISYWTAWAKANHPMEFAVANLNHAEEKQALKLLRDMVTYDGIEYIFFDADKSLENWSVSDGKLLGGLCSLHGIAHKKAKDILACRKGPKKYTSGMMNTLMSPQSVFQILFPCEHWWGMFTVEPEEYGLENPPVEIQSISGTGQFLFIGKMVECKLVDLNEASRIARRDGQVLTENTSFVSLKLEDDTDTIKVIISRYEFERLGREIVETGKVDHDWYLVKGNVNNEEWRNIFVEEILNLNQWGKQNGFGPDVVIEN